MSFTIVFEPDGIKLLCDRQITVSEAARRAGVNLKSVCGGQAVCGKCQVRLMGHGLSPTTKFEKQLLPERDLTDGWRLACRTVVSEDISVYVPDFSRVETQIIQIDSEQVELKSQSSVRMFPIKVSPPSLEDQMADLERVSVALEYNYGIEGVWANLPTLKTLRETLRNGNWGITVALRGDEMIGVFEGEITSALGLAVDIGTSKLACYLVDLNTGKTLTTKGVMNPQIASGEDLMTRLGAAIVSPTNSKQLQEEVIEAINAIVIKLCSSQGEEPGNLLDFCFVGNTAMHHLILGLPVKPLAVVPFVPAIKSSIKVRANQLGLVAAPDAQAYFPPPIAGFVGSDHLAFLLAAGFGKDARTRLGIDIGTNTEIALQVDRRITTCSTASGPAFEGRHIKHGMRAAPGAIEHVWIKPDGTTRLDVIGECMPAGICGSGVLDVLAELRSLNIINDRGRLIPGKPGVAYVEQSPPQFILVEAENGQGEITINQEDIDQILLAKGAIRAGIEILMDNQKISLDEIDDIVIAGAFGTYLYPYNAIRVGLLPKVPLSRVHAIGNGAGAGARIMLTSMDARNQTVSLAKKIEYLELTVYPGFNKYFANGIRLPAPNQPTTNMYS